MSGILEVHECVTVEIGADVLGIGSLDAPVRKTVGENVNATSRITLQPGEQFNAWSYNVVEPRFALFVAQILQGAPLLAYRTDKPADLAGGDYAPSGTAVRWRHLYLSCGVQFRFTSDLVPGHPINVNETAGSTTVPSLWSDPDRTTHKIYAISLFNPSDAEEDVILRRMWASLDT